jgi:hypothetical protein
MLPELCCPAAAAAPTAASATAAFATAASATAAKTATTASATATTTATASVASPDGDEPHGLRLESRPRLVVRHWPLSEEKERAPAPPLPVQLFLPQPSPRSPALHQRRSARPARACASARPARRPAGRGSVVQVRRGIAAFFQAVAAPLTVAWRAAVPAQPLWLPPLSPPPPTPRGYEKP